MDLTAADYAEMLRRLLPPGAIWQADPGSVQEGVLAAWAAELARVDGRVADLLRESLPETADEMLGEWEAEFGLPEPCDTRTGLSADERRARLAAKAYGRLAQGRARWEALAAQYGAAIEMEQFQPSEVGSLATDFELMPANARYGWRITILGPPTALVEPELDAEVPFPLGDFERSPFECAARQRNPAHMVLIVGYTVI
jgi:uncharacterized protein YmfQ (DUF2313 family)